MKNLTVKSFGPIKNADINFGDLTLFIGPQASGKSILLQLIKLLVDKKHIRRTLNQYGFTWDKKDVSLVLDRYFGEGMSKIWTDKSKIVFDKKSYSAHSLLPRKREDVKGAVESLFYIPAQRVVCLQNGWPRFFTEYDDSVPYVLRHFSETLRLFMERGRDKGDVIFPLTKRLKEPLREAFNSSIFHDGKIVVDREGRKRINLNIAKTSLPFMTWSAGQKEFMPLLLGFYWVCPATAVSKKDDLKYVVIEEPEMGLHPQAIQSVLLQVMDLMSRGYKVIISTHSPVLLEFAWALRYLQNNNAETKSLAELFDLKYIPPSTRQVLESVLREKDVNTYFFSRIGRKVSVKDISTLDASSDDPNIAQWGGLSSFSAKASEIVSRTVSK